MQNLFLPRRTQVCARMLAVLGLLLMGLFGTKPYQAAAAPSPFGLEFDGADDSILLNSFLSTTLPGTNAPNGNATVNTVAGELRIDSSGGDLLPGGTAQDNALAVSYGSSGSYTIGARLIKPAFGLPYQSAGIYIGKSSSQYIRLSLGVGSKGSTGERLQLDVMESNGKLRSTTIPLPNKTLANANTFDLFLTVDHGGSGKIAALYRINSDDPQQGRLATSRNFPRWLRGNAGTVYAGVVSTHRGTLSPVTASFDWFRVTAAPQVVAIIAGLKTVDKDGVSPGQSVQPGDTLTYTISVTNNGTATSVTLNDPIPVDTRFNGSLTRSPGTLPAATFDSATNRVSWSGQLGTGQSVTISFQVTINQAPLQSSTIVNTASVAAANSGFPALVSASTVVGLTPDLSGSTYSASPATVGPDGTVTYTLNLSNDGTAAANGATAQLLVPVGTTLVANSATWSSGSLSIDPSLRMLTWSAAGPLAINGAATISFSVKVGGGFANGEAIVSRAIVQATGVLPTIEDAQAIFDVATTVSGTKTVDKAEADPGAPLTYTITVTNNSGATANDIQVVDQIPLDTSYQGNLATSPGAPAPSYENGNNRVVWQIPSLIASQSITMSFQVQIATQAFHSAAIVNKAVLTTTGANASQTLLSATTLVRGVADLSNSLYTADPALVGPNGTITYALYLLNDGTAAANNATADLTIPAGTTLVPNSAAASSGGLTVNTALNKITWAAGSPLPIGALVRISFEVKLPISVTSSVFASTATMQADGTAPNIETALSTFSQSAPPQTEIYVPIVTITR